MNVKIKTSTATLKLVNTLSKLQIWICKVFKITPQYKWSVDTKLYLEVITEGTARQSPIRINDMIRFSDGTIHLVITFGEDTIYGRYILTRSIDILSNSPYVGDVVSLFANAHPEA